MGGTAVPPKRAKQRAPHKRPTADLVELRRSEVEEALQRPNGWNARFRAQYMTKWGIGLQTMWDDRTAILLAWDIEVNSEPRRSVRAQLVKRAQFAGGLAENRVGFDQDGAVYTAPDVGNMLKGISVEAKLMGANAPERVEVEHSGSIGLDVNGMTPRELAILVIQSLPDALLEVGLEPIVIDIPAQLEQDP